MFAVMIQDDGDYVSPELCFAAGTNDIGIYKSKEAAQEMIQYLVGEGFPEDSYFVVELKRVE